MLVGGERCNGVTVVPVGWWHRIVVGNENGPLIQTLRQQLILLIRKKNVRPWILGGCARYTTPGSMRIPANRCILDLCLNFQHKKTAAAAAAVLAAAGGLAGPQTRAGLAAYPAAALAGGAAGALGAAAGGAVRRDDLLSTNEPVYCVCRQVGWGDMVSGGELGSIPSLCLCSFYAYNSVEVRERNIAHQICFVLGDSVCECGALTHMPCFGFPWCWAPLDSAVLRMATCCTGKCREKRRLDTCTRGPHQNTPPLNPFLVAWPCRFVCAYWCRVARMSCRSSL